MYLDLKPETQALIDKQLKSGRFQTPDEVIHAALVSLSELGPHLIDSETLDAIERAEEQIDRGEYREWSEVRKELREKYLDS